LQAYVKDECQWLNGYIVKWFIKTSI